LLRVRLAMVHVKCPAVALGGLDLEFPHCKCEQISRDGFCFRVPDVHAIACGLAPRLDAVRYRLPCGWNVELESVTGLQIRLVEAREGEVRAGRNKKGVHELGIAVERRISGFESDLNAVFTWSEEFLRNHDMSVADVKGDL